MASDDFLNSDAGKNDYECANEPTVDPNRRGGYLAFATQDSARTRYLKRLSAAGRTHLCPSAPKLSLYCGG